MANPTRRLGVVLFQLGGPDTPQAIEPFLFNLFCDPDIIDFPFARIGRKPLAKLISSTRAKKVLHHYAAIGGASPIRRFTEQQADALRTGSGLMALTLIVLWPCATGIRLRPRQSNKYGRRDATKSYSSLFIRSIPALPPEAASTNGAACLQRGTGANRRDVLSSPALPGRACRED